MIYPAFAICAIGNRTWGIGYLPHFVGAIIMGIGLWENGPHPLIALPMLMFLAFAYRVFTSAPWLNMEDGAQGDDYDQAITRGILLIPIIVVETYLKVSLMPLVIGIACIFVFVPFSYYLAAKQTRIDATGLAEFVTGCFIGLI